MDRLLHLRFYLDRLGEARHWLEQNALVLSVATLGQLAAIGLALLVAWRLSPLLQRLLAKAARRRFEAQITRASKALEPLTVPTVWLLLLWFAVLAASRAGLPLQLINLVVSLVTAWVVIRLVTALVRDPAWARFAAVTVWGLAALNILGLLAPATRLLDSAAITLGTLRVSLLSLAKAVLSLAVLLWLATLAGRILERRVTQLTSLTPSLQVLIVKLLKIALGVIAVVAALRVVGIDLTDFAVLTGAIGVGIGFGLQKIVSNFVSGVTILLDKSIKPGDVLAVGGTHGRVHSLGARYVSVVTRDGTEYLIPNEELVTQQVINWSHSSEQVRLRAAVGISYKADVRLAIALCIEAALSVGRVLADPAPGCLLTGFGDSAIDLEIRFWIRDPMNGVANVKSEVLLKVWDAFREHGIEIPFPQRDLHLGAPVEFVLKPAGGGEDPPPTRSRGGTGRRSRPASA